MKMTNIAIVGAGVIGLTTATAVKEAFPKSHVTIYADVFTPETTGDGSAGLWGPFVIGDTPEIDVIRWGEDTHRWFENFWKHGLAQEVGVSLMAVTRVTKREGFVMPSWASVVYGAVQLTDEELRRWNEEHGSSYKGGMHFVTYAAEPTRLLPWLMNKFTAAGGVIRKKRINSFDELAEDGYDVVINCTGLGARKLTNDPALVPVRGQVTRVKAPWAFNAFIEEDSPGNYIIPNTETVIMGGSATPNDYDTDLRSTETKFIRDGCARILPALEGCEVVKHWAGLRPRRSRVRVEREYRSTASGNKLEVIHNYGHGGAGVTLSWGCALNVVEILRNTSGKNFELSSKL